VAPTFEAVELRLDSDQPTYTGSVRIELQVKEATRTFRFHANGQEFQRLTLKGAGGPIDVHVERGEEGLVTASTEAPLAPGPTRWRLISPTRSTRGPWASTAWRRTARGIS
jgi:aminopeptidase N